ncbi:hypothetical protein SPRG_11745 [Saprolegnia parasitica CBS 223.65]|uniref:subtilisin n=1 Tax=Saprolegnia parasitica (strain CBS 223.65) TaxID=695850 RepID=A0A067C8M9_SAPPC|nr:hypothetical protein SPRG_11745 [Saprolegnia parasitica CBS 223.65]KDO22901.1 hypothetical protein SPRG_11745 [Saprolegnia parasitica CBS 223.65]|eukprot:XP_012206341.1 hypothetical protein SPRG_11745 [Saprolegnia parasitica CBS 223.65]
MPAAFAGIRSSHKWHHIADADDTRPLSWTIGLAAHDPTALLNTLTEVSTPGHPRYGKYLDMNAANALTAPASFVLDALHMWLGHRRTTYSAATNTLVVHSSVRETRLLLRTSIGEFRHRTYARMRAFKASSPIVLPAHIQALLTFTSLTTGPLHPKPHGSRIDPSAPDGIPRSTPSFLRSLYRVPPNATANNATQAIAAFYDEAWSPDDLARFQRMFGPTSAFTVVAQRGDRLNDASHPTGEASLDLQYITAMAPGANTTVWSIDGSNPSSSEDEPFMSWAHQVLSDPAPALVHSISYGDEEARIMRVAKPYAFHLDTLFQKMAVRGLTVLVASGDDGVAGVNDDGSKNATSRCAVSAPEWPASSPYVTTVGGTQLGDDGDEVVCSGATNGVITSGGGFSNVLSPRPPCTVANRFFNHHGRGYPDVSALSTNYPVVIDGRVNSLYGTSASTPVVAGLVTLWNELRLTHGQAPLGFLNPLLYQMGARHGSAFFDVLVGDNGASANGAFVCPHAFGAGPGWDAVSGWGTPRFDLIARCVLDTGNAVSK